MSYFEDLSIYSYRNCELNDKYKTLNVGWLDRGHLFSKGHVGVQVLEKLIDFISIGLVVVRGFHVCNLCSKAKDSPLVLKYKEKRLTLGFAEIRVFGDHNKIYAAPNLIFHYILEHKYKPPEEFIDAVLNGPCPFTDEYNKLLQINYIKINAFHKLVEGPMGTS